MQSFCRPPVAFFSPLVTQSISCPLFILPPLHSFASILQIENTSFFKLVVCQCWFFNQIRNMFVLVLQRDLAYVPACYKASLKITRSGICSSVSLKILDIEYIDLYYQHCIYNRIPSKTTVCIDIVLFCFSVFSFQCIFMCCFISVLYTRHH